ncbi:MAG: glycosyltransferase [Chitinophagales bacterium]
MEITAVKIFVSVIIAIYTIALSFIFFYSLAQLHLVYQYLFKKKNLKAAQFEDNIKQEHFPFVSVQLPIYNEKLVASRLIDAIAKLDYPTNKLEIQVLDDSTDETFDIIAERVSYWKNKGFDILHIHRTDRSGFKAGALAHSLQIAKGEFIAIFDADFLPEKDFLLKTIPCFFNPEIGMVQTRWEHINKNYSLLTQMQAFGLDGHFVVEQSGRNISNSFINFNGTAGVWRKKCIEDSGNWNFDTLTEDLDLSYRAQMKGWKFKYLEDVTAPAELPPVMSALKSQQYRWTKGGAETARKHFWNVMKLKMPLKTRFHAIFHLLNNLVFIAVISSAIVSVPLVYFKNRFSYLDDIVNYASIFILSFLAIGALYFVSNLKNEKSISKALGKFMIKFPLFLAISMGLSLHNAIAVAQGYIGKKTPFIRTPKFNITQEHKLISKSNYVLSSINLITILEGLLVLYFSFGLAMAAYFGEYSLMPFLFMLCLGFALVFYYSLFNEKFKS